MHTTTTRAARPRSLVTHIIHLTGANPVDARLFANSSGRAAIKRLNIKPAVKTRTKTTVMRRHLIIADGMGVKKHVRRKKGVPVHRWTLAQAVLIIHEMKPRKDEYKEIRQRAHAALPQPVRDTLDDFSKNAKSGLEKAKRTAITAITDAGKPKPLRRLPRHRTRSKRR